MNNKILIVGLIVLILGIGAGLLFYYSSNKSTGKNVVNTSITNESHITNDENPENTTASSRYIEYSNEKYKNILGKKVLFFYASWCPTCRPADKSFQENLSRIPADTTLIRVNYNDPQTDEEEKKLAEKYKVTYQHTFVQIDEEGNEIKKWNGGEINELIANIE